MVADALQILDDHQQIQRCIHLAGVFGDLLRQLMLDGVEIVVHRVVCGNDLARRQLIFGHQGGKGIQDHLVSLFAHGNGLTYRRVALFADGDKVGDDLGDVGGMVADALNVRDHLHGRGDAAQVARHRLLTQQQGHAAVLDVPLHVVDAGVPLHDGRSCIGVSNTERFQSVLHGISRVAAHFGQRIFQRFQIGVVLFTDTHSCFLL